MNIFYGRSSHICLSMCKQRWFFLGALLLLPAVLLVSCSDPIPGGGNTPSVTATVTTSQVKWCGKPLVVFRDEGAALAGTPTVPASGSLALPPANGTPKALTNWDQVKANLGFTVYLPATLPQGTCLVSVQGTLRDPVLGSSFTIGYLLPNHDAISLSLAPLRSKTIAFQCSVSNDAAGTTPKNGTPAATPVSREPIQYCTGSRDTTSIVFSARGNTATLQKFFESLQPNVNWTPAA